MWFKNLMLVAVVAVFFISPLCHADESQVPDYTVKLPGQPFDVASTSDDAWLFVSLVDNKSGALAVLKNAGGHYMIDHVVPLDNPAYGEAISGDGSVLLVAEGDYIQAFDVRSLIGGKAEGVEALSAGRGAGAIYAKISSDSKIAFVSEERSNQVAVIDLDRLKGGAGDKSIISKIPTGISPVGLDLSPDGKFLYVTSEVFRANGADSPCRPEGGAGRPHPEGVLMKVDVEASLSDPGHAITGLMRAGCNPVRVAMSPTGKELWVTARGGNSILRIPEDAWTNTKNDEMAQVYPVGPSPVGIAVRPDDAQVWVTMSDRFNRNGGGSVEGFFLKDKGLDARTVRIEKLEFPRELSFLHDNRTIVFTLFNANEIGFYRTPE